MSEVFWTVLLTTLCGVFLKVISMAYKSKCVEVDLCCIKIKRDIPSEIIDNNVITSKKDVVLEGIEL